MYIGFAMKKFINRPEDVVEEMLQGIVMLHPGSAHLPGHKVIVRTDVGHERNQQVAVISGGEAATNRHMRAMSAWAC